MDTKAVDPKRNPAQVYLSSLAKGSRPAMAGALDTMASIITEGANRLTLDWAALTFAETSAIRAELSSRYAPATANKMLSALRGTLKNAWRLGLMDVETYQRAADLKSVTGQTIPTGRAVATNELTILLAKCGDGPTGARDAAVIGLMYSGLRRAEVINLDLADYNQIGNEVKVRGKRHKERRVPLMPGVDKALVAWLKVRGEWAGPLFVNIRRGGHLQRRRLTTGAINHLLTKLVGRAGVIAVTPHDFRRSLISDLLDAGADIATVADLVGHTNVQTTRRYDRRGERARRRAMDLLSLPQERLE
jgi:site-specific recombinase XerD